MSASPVKESQRLEAFSDGVIAILITIMVLELKVPHGAGLSDIAPLFPVFRDYVLSFAYLGIYLNNHHHLIGAAARIDGRIMWANLHLLFWLSLIPFVTAWMGENQAAPWPTAFYGGVLLLSAAAYFILQGLIVAGHGRDSELAKAVGRDWKGKLSLACYVCGTVAAFRAAWFSHALFAFVALLWIVPDRRVRLSAGEKSA